MEVEGPVTNNSVGKHQSQNVHESKPPVYSKFIIIECITCTNLSEFSTSLPWVLNNTHSKWRRQVDDGSQDIRDWFFVPTASHPHWVPEGSTLGLCLAHTTQYLARFYHVAASNARVFLSLIHSLSSTLFFSDDDSRPFCQVTCLKGFSMEAGNCYVRVLVILRAPSTHSFLL